MLTQIRVNSLTVRVQTQTLNPTLAIVFLALTDLESQKGDKSKNVKNMGKFSGINKATKSTSSCSDKCDTKGEDDLEGDIDDGGRQSPKVSYSVSYFTWSVSDQSSEDECENITITLDRMKLRRTSRERNNESSLKERRSSINKS